MANYITTDATPDAAIEMLRTLVFEHERVLAEWMDRSRESVAADCEDYHTALVVLQRYLDKQEEDTGDDGPEETLA